MPNEPKSRSSLLLRCEHRNAIVDKKEILVQLNYAKVLTIMIGSFILELFFRNVVSSFNMQPAILYIF